MVVAWVREHDDLYAVEISIDPYHKFRLQVENLVDITWDWNVRAVDGISEQRRGLSSTASEAKSQAELAVLGLIMGELHQHCTT